MSEEEARQPIAIELIPNQHRDAAMILIRSNGPMRMEAVVNVLETFVGQLKEKMKPSKIERLPPNKIIVP
jgi:hypothetical protein